MEHGTSTEWVEDGASEYKTKLGVRMFIMFVIVYTGFILINSLNPKLMGINIGKVNLAFFYGIGLIIYALILATIYNYLCTKKENEMAIKNQVKNK